MEGKNGLAYHADGDEKGFMALAREGRVEVFSFYLPIILLLLFPSHSVEEGGEELRQQQRQQRQQQQHAHDLNSTD